MTPLEKAADEIRRGAMLSDARYANKLAAAAITAFLEAAAEDAVAEALWQDESERATGRRRNLLWSEAGNDTREKWQRAAKAAILALKETING